MVAGGSLVAWFHMGDTVVAAEKSAVDKAKDLVNK